MDKNYKLIAEGIRNGFANAWDYDSRPEYYGEIWREVAESVADNLATQDKHFNRDKFLADCGVSDKCSHCGAIGTLH